MRSLTLQVFQAQSSKEHNENGVIIVKSKKVFPFLNPAHALNTEPPSREGSANVWSGLATKYLHSTSM